jgi:hypothetical protein
MAQGGDLIILKLESQSPYLNTAGSKDLLKFSVLCEFRLFFPTFRSHDLAVLSERS